MALTPEQDLTPRRHWNSWDSIYPARFLHLPSGVEIAVCAYAASQGRFTRFAMGEEVELGERSIDGERLSLRLSVAGNSFAIEGWRADEATYVVAWRPLRLVEWGLRVWLLLALRWPGGDGSEAVWHLDPADGSLSAALGPTRAYAKPFRPALMTTFHADLDALESEFADRGYFYLGSRGKEGRCAVLRYNFEETPEGRVAIAIGKADTPAMAARALPRPLPVLAAAPSPALAAVRDTIGWLTVWDRSNRRPYTALSRSWVAQKFGGWGVWLDDLFYHGLMAAAFDRELAMDNLRAVLAGAQANGMLPCLLTGNDRWIDRSQPPIGSLAVWLMFKRHGLREAIELAYPILLANHRWWLATRDGNGDGLYEYGSSPVGDGLYRGSKLAAKDESSMDNSPTHDEASFVAERHTLDCADVGLNSLIALDGELLSKMARVLSKTSEAEAIETPLAGLRAKIGALLWDDARQCFANRLWSGKFVRSIAPTSFYPLLCGAASPAQARAMLAKFEDPNWFGGHWLLPSVAREDPAIDDNVYWRGRIWPPLNFLVWHGLRRYGFDREAAMLAENGERLFMGEWRRHRRCAENYNSITGAAADQPDTDLFYGWGALLPYLAAYAADDLSIFDAPVPT